MTSASTFGCDVDGYPLDPSHPWFRGFAQDNRPSQKKQILDAIEADRQRLDLLGRNAAARELAKLGFGEDYARKIITDQRRKVGTKKVVPGDIIRLADRKKV